MTTLHHEIRIAAPPERVWPAVAELEAVAHYNPSVASARCTTQLRSGVGAMRLCELHPRGSVEERVTLWDPPRRIGFEVAKSDWPIVFMRWETRIEPDAGATRVSQSLDYRVKFGPLGSLLDALVMRRMLDRSIGEVFAALKTYVEDS